MYWVSRATSIFCCTKVTSDYYRDASSISYHLRFAPFASVENFISRGDRGWLTHFFMKIFKLLWRKNHSCYFDSDCVFFFIKLLTKKESENI